MSPTQRITKVEWVFVLVATLLGLGLRFWHLDRLAVEHFDEGVYASNLFFTERDNFRYPNQHLYAPPLVPGLIEWSMTFLGMEPWVPMIPGILLGAATVPLLWWMLRGLAGPLAAMLACWLLATNEYHIFYSRTALTEPVLGFFWVLALGLGARALLVPLADNPRRAYTLAALAGLTCGLCWWTKYNGWLTAFLLTATAALQWLIMERTSSRLKQNLILVGITLGVTVLVYAPYIWSLQPTGGYLAVSANHRQYFQGMGSWWKNLDLQFSDLDILQKNMTGGLGALSVFGILYWFKHQTEISDQPQEGRPSDRKCLESEWLILCVLTTIFFSSASIFGLALLSGWCIYECCASRKSFMQTAPLAIVLSMLWVGMLIILIPLYYPYPRLLMPAMIGCILSYALLTNLHAHRSLTWWKENPNDKQLKKSEQTRTQIWIWYRLVILYGLIGMLTVGTRIYEPRNGLANSVSEVAKTVIPNGDPNAPVIVYVYGEPAVYWHLSRQQVLAGPVSDLEFASSETRPSGVSLYLVTGPHAGQTPAFATQMEARKDLFDEVGKFDYEPSLLIKMDEVGGDPKAKKVETLTLWKVK
ncbi:ArnT family glycosyltransferase [Lacunimicrobium album]